MKKYENLPDIVRLLRGSNFNPIFSAISIHAVGMLVFYLLDFDLIFLMLRSIEFYADFNHNNKSIICNCLKLSLGMQNTHTSEADRFELFRSSF